MRNGNGALYVDDTYLCDICSSVLIGECVMVNNITYKIENKVYPVISNSSGTFEYDPRIYAKQLYPRIIKIADIIKKDYDIDILSYENDMFWNKLWKNIIMKTVYSDNFIDAIEINNMIRIRLKCGEKVAQEIIDIFRKTV